MSALTRWIDVGLEMERRFRARVDSLIWYWFFDPGSKVCMYVCQVSNMSQVNRQTEALHIYTYYKCRRCQSSIKLYKVPVTVLLTCHSTNLSYVMATLYISTDFCSVGAINLFSIGSLVLGLKLKKKSTSEVSGKLDCRHFLASFTVANFSGFQ